MEWDRDPGTCTEVKCAATGKRGGGGGGNGGGWKGGALERG